MKFYKYALLIIISFVLMSSVNVMGAVYDSTQTSYELAYKLNSDGKNTFDFPSDVTFETGNGYTLDVTLYRSENNVARINGFGNSPEIFVDLEIPSTITFDGIDYTVNEIADNAFDTASKKFINNIRGLSLPDSVETIGDFAFRGCEYMLYAYMPGVKAVGQGAFKSCLELTNVKLAEGLTYIPYEMFYDCRSLVSVTIPSTVTKFETNSINNCKKLQSVAILGSNTEFSNFTFGVGTDDVKFYVRNDEQKTFLNERYVNSADYIVVTGSNTAVLYNGYNYDIETVCAGEEDFVLPSSAQRNTERFILNGWSDGETIYSPGEKYTFGNKTIVSLNGQWISNNDYKGILTLNEIKEAKPDDKTMNEIVGTVEVDTPSVTGNITVNVKESETVNEIKNQNLFGVQFEIQTNKFLNDENELSQYYLDAANSGKLGSIPIARWGGDSTNNWNLYVNMRPYDERLDSINLNTGKVQYEKLEYGPVEFIKTVLATNPDAQFVFSISMLTMTPDESVKFYRILTDESGEYAEIRKNCGIDKPINLVGFELGNEVYHDWSNSVEPWVTDKNGNKSVNPLITVYYDENNRFGDDTVNLTVKQVANAYADVALTHIKALKEYDSNVMLMPVLVNNTGLDEGMIWNRIIAQKLGSYIDAGVIHYYTGITVSSHKTENDVLDTIKQIFREEQGYQKDLKFALTEHALFSGGQEITYLSLRAVVSDAMYFINQLNRNDILFANYHNFYGTTNWSYVQDIGGTFVRSGIADFYEVFKQNLGEKVVGLEYEEGNVSNISSVEASSLSAMISGEDELILVLVNTKTLARNEYISYDYTFNFENEYTLVSETTFTAPNYYSYKVNADSKDIFTTTTRYFDKDQYSKTLNYVLNPCRVVFLKLKANKPILSSKINEPAEKENVIYKDLLEGATVNGKEYVFANADKVDRILYSGSNEDFAVYLKNTEGNWEKMTDYSGFTDGSFYNKYTDKLYYAAMFENMSENDVVTLLTDVDRETEICADDGTFKLYPRISGTDCFDNYNPDVDDETKTVYENGVFVVKKTGKVNIEVSGIKFIVNLVKGTERYGYSEDFENWNDESIDWLGNFTVKQYKNFTGTDQSDDSDVGDDVINSNILKPGEINSETNQMIIPVLNHSHRDDEHKIVYYNKDRTGLSDRQQISFDISRVHRNQELGIRFMVHNENKNYYELRFKRANGNGYQVPAWQLYKVTDGVYTLLKEGMSYGGHSVSTGCANFTLTADRGKISWKATSSGVYSMYCGEYIDENPFSFAGNDATFGFFGYLVEVPTADDVFEILVDNVTVKGLSVCDSEESSVAYFGSTSGGSDYKIAYRLNNDKTLSVSGFSIYPNDEYILNIPETADYYYDESNSLVRLQNPLPVAKINADAFAKGYVKGGSELISYSEENPNDLLKGIDIEGKRLNVIESNAFSYCKNDEFTEFSTYAKNISGNAFVNCNSLTALNIQNPQFETVDGDKLNINVDLINVRTEDVKAYLTQYTDALIRVYFETEILSDDNSYALSLVFNEDAGTVTGFYEYPKNPVNLYIPSEYEEDGLTYGIKEIKAYAFANTSENQTKYGVDNFDAVKTVYVEDGVEKIGEYAFSGKDNPNDMLTEAYIPGSVKKPGNALFKSCRFLTKIELGEGITHIPSEMLYNCQRISKVVLPSTVEEIALSFVGGVTHSLGEVVVLSENIKFTYPTERLCSSGRDTKGTVYYTVNENMKTLFESKQPSDNDTRTNPQKVQLITSSDPEIIMENGVVTMSNADGFSKNYVMIVAEYEDSRYDKLKCVRKMINTLGILKDSKKYDLSGFKNKNCKVFVFEDTVSLIPVCKSMIP